MNAKKKIVSADPPITCVPNREGWSVRITGNSWTVAPLVVTETSDEPWIVHCFAHSQKEAQHNQALDHQYTIHAMSPQDLACLCVYSSWRSQHCWVTENRMAIMHSKITYYIYLWLLNLFYITYLIKPHTLTTISNTMSQTTVTRQGIPASSISCPLCPGHRTTSTTNYLTNQGDWRRAHWEKNTQIWFI